MDPSESLSFLKDLKSWYWKYGVARSGKYELSKSTWLRTLYQCDEDISVAKESLDSEKPAMAIWGPSQTGKSTLLSAYLDKNAKYEEDPEVDGCESALHWEGGAPFFFMAPRFDGSMKSYMSKRVLNPFNNGWDGSACLSRFSAASADAGKEKHVHLENVQHPVTLKLATLEEIWHSLALGYASECLDSSHSGKSVSWDTDKLDYTLNKLKRNFTTKDKAPQQEAYELLYDFTKILTSLVEAKINRYVAISDVGRDQWIQYLGSLLVDEDLLSQPKLVRAFAYQVFWDSYDEITGYFEKIETFINETSQKFGDKPLQCSLETTALFLNMQACVIYYDSRPSDPNSDEYSIYELIGQLGYREEGSSILLGCGSDYPNSLGSSAEQFAILQGLVWELQIPINTENLPKSPLKDFLEESDLLDFPGVGNETAGEASRIELEKSREEVEAKGIPFEPKLFFSRVVKRGKTASIVANYAKKLNIDGFNIFQAVDGFPAANADQLINGIENWWKAFVPDYFANQKGESPLPLNTVVTWWAKKINESKENAGVIYGSIVPFLVALDKIGDPDVCTTFALNYHRFKARGGFMVDFDRNSQRYATIRKEPDFINQFRSEVSLTSFDAMIDDKETGGTDYFFTQVKLQILKAWNHDTYSRKAILSERLSHALKRLESLYIQKDLVPPAEEEDTRVNDLNRFEKGIRSLVEDKDDDDVVRLNFSLRSLLNVAPEILDSVPANPIQVNEGYIKRQFERWRQKQCEQLEVNPGATVLDNSDHSVQDGLDAIITSIAPEIKRIARWLKEFIENSRTDRDSNNQYLLRRHLALKMSNALVYGDEGPPIEDQLNSISNDLFDEEPLSEQNGTQSFYYTTFIKPFLDERLSDLVSRNLDPDKRPEDIAGDPEILELTSKYDLSVED